MGLVMPMYKLLKEVHTVIQIKDNVYGHISLDLRVFGGKGGGGVDKI